MLRHAFKPVISIFVISILGMGVLSHFSFASTEDPRATYRQIYSLITSAENSASQGNLKRAIDTYQTVLIHLQDFQQAHPDWEPDIIQFRTQYAKSQINKLTSEFEKQSRSSIPPVSVKSPAATSSAIGSKMSSAPPPAPKQTPLEHHQQQPSPAPSPQPQPSPIASNTQAYQPQETPQPTPARPTRILPPQPQTAAAPAPTPPTHITQEHPSLPQAHSMAMNPPQHLQQTQNQPPPPRSRAPQPPSYTQNEPYPSPSPSYRQNNITPPQRQRYQPQPSSSYNNSFHLSQPSLATSLASSLSGKHLQNLAQEVEARVVKLEEENRVLKAALAEAESRAAVSSNYVKVLARENEFLQAKLNREIQKLDALRNLLYSELSDQTTRWNDLQYRVQNLLEETSAPMQLTQPPAELMQSVQPPSSPSYNDRSPQPPVETELPFDVSDEDLQHEQAMVDQILQDTKENILNASQQNPRH